MHPEFADIIDDTIETRNRFFPKAKIAVLSNSTMLHKEDVPEYVREHDFEVLIVLGAGDLDNYVPQIEKILLSKYE